MTNELPSGWQMARLGDLGTEVRGQISPESGTTYDLYSVPAFATGQPEQFDGESIRSGKRPVEEHDVLLCKINPRINRVWVVGPSHGLPQIASMEYLVLRPHEPRMAAYLRYYLSAPRFRDWIRLAVEGATGSHTRAKSGPILEQLVPVPSLAEQQRIVAAIDQHFSRLDAIESTVERGLRAIAALRMSLLTAAVKVDRTLPRHWQRKEISEVADVQLGRQRSPQHHAGPQMRPYLRAANVTWAGLSLDDVKQMNFDEGEFETYRLHPGDLLLNEASGSPNEVGKPGVWRGEIEDCCFQNTLLRLRAREIDPDYLYWYCYMAASTGRFGEAGRGVNIRHLGKQGLARFPIAVAPRAEQGDIVIRLQERFQQSRECETSVRRALDLARALRRSILAKAFGGRLVPRNPGDEAGSDLMESRHASAAV